MDKNRSDSKYLYMKWITLMFTLMLIQLILHLFPIFSINYNCYYYYRYHYYYLLLAIKVFICKRNII